MHSFRAALLILMSAFFSFVTIFLAPGRAQAQQTPQPNQRLVESVDITGNRRLRKDDEIGRAHV